MEIKNLKVFVSVAEGESMSSIAESLGITKSTVSYIISSIEKELCADLFIHGNGVLQLTESGILFLSVAKKIVSQYESGIEKIQKLRNEATGDLRIGIGSFVEPILRKAVAKLLADNPSLKIDAHVYKASTLNQLLKAGKIDVAFTLNKAYPDEGIVSDPCIPIKIMCIASKKHPLANKDIVTFDDLCKYDCIIPAEDRRAIATINKYFDKELSRLRRRITINTADGALNMVEEENYITFMTTQHIINRPNLVAIPIEGLEMDVVSNMHYLKDVNLKESAKMLRSYITDYAIPYYKMIDV